MAIRLGNFGNATPGRAPQVTPPAGAFGAGAAAALTRLGGTAVDIATDMRAQELRLEQQERQRQEHIAAEARKAHDGVILQQGEDALRDLGDEIHTGVREGRVPKADAERLFGERAKEVADAHLPQISDEAGRAIAGRRLNGTTLRLGNYVRRGVEQRNRQDITADMGVQLERLSREYRTDPAGAEARAAAVFDTLGPLSTLTPDQVAAARQTWAEKAQYTMAYEAVSAGRTDRKLLDSAERMIGGLKQLDPQQRAQLLDRAQAYRLTMDQKAELAAQRAERERDRLLRRAEHEFNAFQALADKGTALDPAYLDRALQQTAGTPYAAAIRGLAEQARTTGGLAAQPVAAQQRMLDAINAEIVQRGRSPELDKRKDQIEKVLRGSREDLDRDPLRAGLERGVIDALTPLNLTSGVQGLVPQLAERVTAAQRVQQWAGRPVSPLTADEAAGLKTQLDALPIKERSTMVAALASTLGPQQAQGLAAQMDKKDKALALAFSSAGAQTTQNRFTSELILRGQQARADGTSTKGLKEPEIKATRWRTHAATELEGVFANPQHAAQVRDAAELIMHGIAAEQGGRLSSSDMDRAVGLALGGSIVEHAGKRIPLPAGVTADMLETRLRSITPGEIGAPLVRAGGALVGADEFVRTLPAQPLMAVRPGQFAVLVGGRPATDERGEPILIKVK